jgi:hypothetical protein
MNQMSIFKDGQWRPSSPCIILGFEWGQIWPPLYKPKLFVYLPIRHMGGQLQPLKLDSLQNSLKNIVNCNFLEIIMNSANYFPKNLLLFVWALPIDINNTLDNLKLPPLSTH